jgi:magnesium chelatase family protein
MPRPGEISLAHNGVLFLDEMPEFSHDVLEALRQPLEDHIITVARVASTLTYPADFMLIGAMNPCPCGNYGSDKACSCSAYKIQNYLKKISGPLLDRIDLHVEVPRVNYEHLSSRAAQTDSAAMREAVIRARAVQSERLAPEGMRSNAQMQTEQLQRFCRLEPEGERLLRGAFARLQMSGRAYSRVLKVARTVADLEQAEDISVTHLAEALQYRSLDRKYWPH